MPGLQHGTEAAVQIETNLYGPKRMVEAFLPLLNPTEGTGKGSICTRSV